MKGGFGEEALSTVLPRKRENGRRSFFWKILFRTTSTKKRERTS